MNAMYYVTMDIFIAEPMIMNCIYGFMPWINVCIWWGDRSECSQKMGMILDLDIAVQGILNLDTAVQGILYLDTRELRILEYN